MKNLDKYKSLLSGEVEGLLLTRNYKLTSDYDPKNTFDIEKYLNRKEKINPNDEFVVIDADSLPSA